MIICKKKVFVIHDYIKSLYKEIKILSVKHNHSSNLIFNVITLVLYNLGCDIRVPMGKVSRCRPGPCALISHVIKRFNSHCPFNTNFYENCCRNVTNLSDGSLDNIP